uniref:Fungal lipase-type domain-containing protein n=1 Tax=Zea mays TaxID=4577 RepID=A0A804LK90_MAIZE
MAGQRWVGKVAAAAVVALLLLSTALPGGARREPDVNNNGRSFVFNYTLTKAVVEYAAAVYMTDLTALYTWTCSRCNDLTRGFEMTCIIVDVQNCLQGDSREQNWIKDLIWKQVKLNYPNMPNAKVHIGFYSSYNNTVLRPAITNAVRKARKLHGHSDVIVTGHSMGGALASFCALDLAMSFGSNNVHLMTFGQPRVGNAAFASYFAQYVWEHEVDGNTTYQVCDGSGEDPNCCRSVFALFWSASDHLTYMGVEIAADDWSTCRIVLGRGVEQLKGSLPNNIVTSGRSVDVVIADDDTLQID